MKNKKINNNINTIILCAGLGTRMAYKTRYIAKPLIKIKKKPILEINLKYLSNLGIRNCIINNSYKYKTIQSFINNYSYKNKKPNIFSSYEKQRLETGGGIKNALKFINKNNILAINGDSLLVNKNNFCPITNLYKNFQKKDMSIILLLAPIKNTIGYKGQGDFIMQTKNTVSKVKRKSNETYSKGLVFTGWQIIDRKLFSQIKEKKFSLNILYDMAERQKKLYGITLNGYFLHASTPKSIIQIENFLSYNKISL